MTTAEPLQQPASSSRTVLIQCVAVGLLVFAVRAFLILRYGADVPINDQWDAVYDQVLRPYVQGDGLSLTQLFAPHNEHRPLLTRVFSLALFVGHGHWSPLLEMIVQSVFPALSAALVFGWLTKDVPHCPRWLCVWMVVLCFAHSASHSNMLSGFQNSFYLTVLFLCVALRIAATRQLHWASVVLVILLGFLGQLGLATGFIITFLSTAIMACRLATERRLDRAAIGLIGSGALGTLLLFLTVAPDANPSDLQAHSITQMVQSASYSFGWPNWPYRLGRTGLILWLLLSYHAVQLIRRREMPNLFYAGLVAWCLLLVVATALKRGGASLYPANRYGDFLTLIYLPVFYLSAHCYPSARTAFTRLLLIGSIAGLLIVPSGYFFAMLPEQQKSLETRLAMANHIQQAWKAESDEQGLAVLQKTPPTEQCYPSAEQLWRLLHITPLNHDLPEIIRPPTDDSGTVIPARMQWLLSPSLPWTCAVLSLILFGWTTVSRRSEPMKIEHGERSS